MKENKTTTVCGRKGVGDELLELPLENHIGSYESDGRQREDVINNNNNVINKRGPIPLCGVLIPRPWAVAIISLHSKGS